MLSLSTSCAYQLSKGKNCHVTYVTFFLFFFFFRDHIRRLLQYLVNTPVLTETIECVVVCFNLGQSTDKTGPYYFATERTNHADAYVACHSNLQSALHAGNIFFCIYSRFLGLIFRYISFGLSTDIPSGQNMRFLNSHHLDNYEDRLTYIMTSRNIVQVIIFDL